MRSNLIFGLALLMAACSARNDPDLEDYRTAEELVRQHLDTFDDLDFNVFTNQKWDELHRSHSDDIKVHWPDGHVTEGLDVHIADLEAMFVFAPDTRIVEHPIKLGSGPWTAVMGYMEGTFSQPMPLPDGTVIPPTGRSYRIAMATIGHWTNGVMNEEWLFWDNQSFMNQIGLGSGD
jgi:predicted ester cyclase